MIEPIDSSMISSNTLIQEQQEEVDIDRLNQQQSNTSGAAGARMILNSRILGVKKTNEIRKDAELNDGNVVS